MRLTKRYPGEPCMRSSIWVPVPEAGGAVTMKFEGRIPRGLAKLLVVVQMDQSRVTPEIDKKMGELAVAMMSGTPPRKDCSCYDDGVMPVLGDGCLEHDHRIRQNVT